MAMTVPELTFGDRLRLARRKAGLEIEDLAAKLDLSPSAIAQWERDLKRPRNLLAAVEVWSEETQTPKGWLLLGEDSSHRYLDGADQEPILRSLPAPDLSRPVQLSLSLLPGLSSLPGRSSSPAPSGSARWLGGGCEHGEPVRAVAT